MKNEAKQLTVGERLTVARRRAGLQQNELAEKAGTTPPAVSMIEADKRRPSLDMASRLADALSVSLDWLAFGDQTNHGDGLREALKEIIAISARDLHAEEAAPEMQRIARRALEHHGGRDDEYTVEWGM